jgi:phosphoenolpyruvate phosphomutase
VYIFNLFQSPVIIVPTKYYATPTERFRQIGVSTVIWANHNLRSSIRAMQDTSAAIFSQEAISQVEKEVRNLQEKLLNIFNI